MGLTQWQTDAQGLPYSVDPLRKMIRAMLCLAPHEDAVYIVRNMVDLLVREAYVITLQEDVIVVDRAASLVAVMRSGVRCAYCAGSGGSFELSADEHLALLRSGHFIGAIGQVARGLFPEEVIQKAIGAHVRLHVNPGT